MFFRVVESQISRTSNWGCWGWNTTQELSSLLGTSRPWLSIEKSSVLNTIPTFRIHSIDQPSEFILLCLRNLWEVWLKISSKQSVRLSEYRGQFGGTFLFSDHPGLTSTSQIEKFQEKAQMELQDYVQKTYSEDTYRWDTQAHALAQGVEECSWICSWKYKLC